MPVETAFEPRRFEILKRLVPRHTGSSLPGARGTLGGREKFRGPAVGPVYGLPGVNDQPTVFEGEGVLVHTPGRRAGYPFAADIEN